MYGLKLCVSESATWLPRGKNMENATEISSLFRKVHSTVLVLCADQQALRIRIYACALRLSPVAIKPPSEILGFFFSSSFWFPNGLLVASGYGVHLRKQPTACWHIRKLEVRHVGLASASASYS